MTLKTFVTSVLAVSALFRGINANDTVRRLGGQNHEAQEYATLNGAHRHKKAQRPESRRRFDWAKPIHPYKDWPVDCYTEWAEPCLNEDWRCPDGYTYQKASFGIIEKCLLIGGRRRVSEVLEPGAEVEELTFPVGAAQDDDSRRRFDWAKPIHPYKDWPVDCYTEWAEPCLNEDWRCPDGYTYQKASFGIIEKCLLIGGRRRAEVEELTFPVGAAQDDDSRRRFDWAKPIHPYKDWPVDCYTEWAEPCLNEDWRCPDGYTYQKASFGIVEKCLLIGGRRRAEVEELTFPVGAAQDDDSRRRFDWIKPIHPFDDWPVDCYDKTKWAEPCLNENWRCPEGYKYVKASPGIWEKCLPTGGGRRRTDENWRCPENYCWVPASFMITAKCVVC